MAYFELANGEALYYEDTGAPASANSNACAPGNANTNAGTPAPGSANANASTPASANSNACAPGNANANAGTPALANANASTPASANANAGTPADANSNALVMLHGWISSHAVFAKPVELLRGKVRCITYDHRGHGGSKGANAERVTMETLASDLRELLVGLGLQDVNLLGWSMGSGVVMTYLEMFGTDRLRQVILCDMTPKQVSDDGWNLGLYQGAFTSQNEADDAKLPFFERYKEFALGAAPKYRKVPGFLLNQGLRKLLTSCDEGVLNSLAGSMLAQDHRGCFAGLDIPLAYFYADPGSLFSPELAQWYEANVPSAFKSVRFQGATHMLVEEQPEKFASEVAALL